MLTAAKAAAISAKSSPNPEAYKILRQQLSEIRKAAMAGDSSVSLVSLTSHSVHFNQIQTELTALGYQVNLAGSTPTQHLDVTW